MQNYEDLKVWDKAHLFVLGIYRVSGCFPRDERYGLTAQIRRSAVSIPSNIAEGCGRDSDPALAYHLEMASGSASESHYQLRLARDLGYMAAADHVPLTADIEEVSRMLGSLRRTIRGRTAWQEFLPRR